MGVIKKISDALKKTRDAFRKKMEEILSGGVVNDDFFDELTDVLISCDIGAETSIEIINRLRNDAINKKIRNTEDIKLLLKSILIEMLNNTEKFSLNMPCVITLIGINGVGKTTSIGKLANYYKNQKKSVMLVAGDTFRAAATDQLSLWADKNKVKVISQGEGSDASAVIFDGITSAKAKNNDVLIVDTAGRLQTKTNLMEELRKIIKTTNKFADYFDIKNLMVIDASMGQNILSQIASFNEYANIDGIIITKLDGTSKGGILFPIVLKYKIPILFVGTGEGLEDIQEFQAQEFVENLF